MNKKVIKLLSSKCGKIISYSDLEIVFVWRQYKKWFTYDFLRKKGRDQSTFSVFHYFHAHTVKKSKIFSHRNFFPSNQLFILVNALLSRNFTKYANKCESKFPVTEIFFRQINSLCKCVAFTKFCQKSVRVNFCNIHTMTLCSNLENILWERLD